MAVNQILNTALSGLRASQAGMRATSTNISNVNTPGYAREEVLLSSKSLNGVGAGVEVEGVRRITDAFLVAAAMSSAARAKSAETKHDLLDRVQAMFGDPSTDASIFAGLNGLYAGFAEVAADPSSPVRRAASVTDLRASLSEFDRLASEIQAVRGEADARITHVVDNINDLLEDVGRLNTQITNTANNGQTSGAENSLSQVLDQLSELIDIRVIKQSSGAVEVRTTDGVLLAGNTIAVLSYSSTGVASPGDTHAPITIRNNTAPEMPLEPHIRSGELRSLLDIRDKELPAVAAILGEFAAKTAESLNKAHSNSTTYPPQRVLQGRDTGLVGADAAGFSGRTTLAVLGADGTLVKQIEIQFNALGGPQVVGSATTAFTTMDELVSALNTELAGVGGSAGFTNGALRLDAGGNRGLTFAEGSPASSRGGRGFAHFFGMNDLVTSGKPLFYETGFAPSDLHQFAGGSFKLALVGASGATLREATVTLNAGERFSDVIADLNNTTSGLGAYGTFSLDGQGELQFTPSSSFTGSSLKVLSDGTQRGTSGRTFTDLFGLGDGIRSSRAFGLAVRSDIEADPSKLALGKVNLAGAAVGDIVTGAGDGTGGSELRAAGSAGLDFDAAGGFPAMTSTLLDYAGRVAGEVGRRSNAAQRELTSASAIRAEAIERRASVEGVNLEEELVALTTYQQSFNAASRLIQAAKEMSDTLMSMI